MLVDLPLEKIPELCTILEKEWPLTMNTVYFMRSFYSLRTRGNPCAEVSLLYSQNNEQSGVLFIIEKVRYSSSSTYLTRAKETFLRSMTPTTSTPGSQNLFVSVFALDGFEENLKTELINSSDVWSDDEVKFQRILEKHMRLIQEVSAIKKYHRTAMMEEHGLIIPREHALKLSISCPKDVEFGPLTENHLDEIYETWHYKSEFSIDIFKQWYELNKKYAIGVFCTKSGALLSGCQRSPTGRINLYIVDSNQRRGYTTLLLMKVAKMMAEDFIEANCFVNDVISLQAGRQIGFVHKYDLNGLYFRKIRTFNHMFVKSSRHSQTKL